MTVYHMKSSLYDRFVNKRTGKVYLDRIYDEKDLGLFLTKEAAVKRITELLQNIKPHDKILEPMASGTDILGFWWAVYSIPGESKNIEWHYEIRERDVFE